MTTCPLCNQRVKGFIRTKENEYVVFCGGTESKTEHQYVEGTGSDFDKATQAFLQKAQPKQPAKTQEQKELI